MASRWVVAAHVSRATGSDFSVTRFGHERYIELAKTNGLWSDEAASNTDTLEQRARLKQLGPPTKGQAEAAWPASKGPG